MTIKPKASSDTDAGGLMSKSLESEFKKSDKLEKKRIKKARRSRMSGSKTNNSSSMKMGKRSSDGKDKDKRSSSYSRKRSSDDNIGAAAASPNSVQSSNLGSDSAKIVNPKVAAAAAKAGTNFKKPSVTTGRTSFSVEVLSKTKKMSVATVGSSELKAGDSGDADSASPSEVHPLRRASLDQTMSRRRSNLFDSNEDLLKDRV